MSFRNAAVVAALLIAACSAEPDSTSDTTLPGPPTTTTATTTTTTEATTMTTTGSTTSTGDPGPIPPLLVAGDEGIQLIDATETRTLLDVPASVAADDLMGGVVFQGVGSESGFFGEPEESIVWWLPEGAEEPRSLLVPTGEQWLRLIGVEFVDGTPNVVYIRSDDRGDFDNARDTLRLYDFGSAEVSEVRTVGGWESGVGHVTFGEGIFASNWFGEAYSGFDFFDTSGDEVSVVGDPYGDAICFDGMIEPGTEDTGAIVGGRCFDNVAISPDGARIAFTILQPDDEGIIRSLELVVVDTGSGSELYRMPIRTEEPYSISSLDIRGDLVLFNQSVFIAEREALPATVVHLTSGRTSVVPVAGNARFAWTLSNG